MVFDGGVEKVEGVAQVGVVKARGAGRSRGTKGAKRAI